jgi:murein DD-endopeptidase MepM/ murein hydrolase activator NlpD
MATAAAPLATPAAAVDPQHAISQDSVKQGDTVEVVVPVQSGAAPPVVTFNKKSYKLFPFGESSARALIGVPADIEPGKYKLQIGDQTRTISVAPGGFVMQRLRLPASKDNFISSPGEEEAVDKAKHTLTDAQMWQGKFHRPSKARTSTGFGQRRIVNGRLLKDYFHSGLDFAGSLGSPVSAAQRGTVILARNGWKLHGNTVAIDHGQGVISFYIHLSKIKVKEGDVVDAGQEIGKVGATGRASGPHLHFSVYVNGDATNPINWFNRSF